MPLEYLLTVRQTVLVTAPPCHHHVKMNDKIRQKHYMYYCMQCCVCLAWISVVSKRRQEVYNFTPACLVLSLFWSTFDRSLWGFPGRQFDMQEQEKHGRKSYVNKVFLFQVFGIVHAHVRWHVINMITITCAFPYDKSQCLLLKCTEGKTWVL